MASNIITVTVNDAKLRALLPRMKQELRARVFAQTLNKLSFDVRDAEREHVAKSFDYASPNTKRFVSESYAFLQKARPTRLHTLIAPRKRGAKVLIDHVKGITFGGSRKDKLRFDSRLAIPKKGVRGVRGKVSKAMLPASLVDKDRKRSKGFQRGAAIIKLSGKGAGQKEEVVFILARQARIKPRLKIKRVAKVAVKANYIRQGKKAFAKLR